MAEHGAHLASSRFEEANKPSIFEVLAQESLMATIHPAMRHALRVFTEKYPAQLGPVLSYFDEIYLVFDAVVQFHYLRKYSSSFAENFYDLKRVPTSDASTNSVSDRLRWRVLACLVLIPYVRHKLDTFFENLRYQMGSCGQNTWRQRNARVKQRLLSLFLKVYPMVHTIWECLTLVYRLNFMLKQGCYHSPSMHLSTTALVRVSEEDKDIDSDHKLENSSWTELSFSGRASRLAQFALNSAAVGLSSGLSMGVFFLQFLEWWYASDASAASLTALPVPDPPQTNLNMNVSPSMCAICRRERTNSTALSVSGHVFCFPCISSHLQRDKCCPVTGFHATSEHLVKIYEQIL